ncbi:MAG: sulfatase [Bacteroidota bacterium]|nr:sulfatase [Bacteroidota bacterium]
MIRGIFLISLLMAGCHQADPQQRPNILWIVGENFKLDLGIYGADHVHTPHLDSLARHGLRYTHVFATSPVCAPSRSAFMTGMYQTSTDTHNMRSHREDDYRLPEGVRPLTHWLADAGYFTANISSIGERIVGTGKLDLNFVNEGPIYQSENWDQLKNNQPFFAQINTPEAEYDIYDRKSAEKARVPWVGEEWHPQIAHPDSITPPPYYPDHPVTRQEWARYLNSVSGMDVRVGWILDRLRADGLADNTIVMFFADNGRLEARGIHWAWDTGLHVPLVIYYPEGLEAPVQYEPGGVVEDVISLLDLTATTLDMAGMEPPSPMQSRRFLGDSPDPPRTYAFSARDRIDETVMRIRSVRGQRYHYIRNFDAKEGFPTLNRYKEKCFPVKPLMRQLMDQGLLSGAPAELMQPRPEEELYDTVLDPHEINNLAGSVEHGEILVTMRSALENWVTETGDLGAVPEPDEVVAPFVDEMHNWFGTPQWAQND